MSIWLAFSSSATDLEVSSFCRIKSTCSEMGCSGNAKQKPHIALSYTCVSTQMYNYKMNAIHFIQYESHNIPSASASLIISSTVLVPSASTIFSRTFLTTFLLFSFSFLTSFLPKFEIVLFQPESENYETSHMVAVISNSNPREHIHW